MRRKTLSSNNKDWSARCAEAAVGGLSALAAVPRGELVKDPALRRLLSSVATEATSAARKSGLCVADRPADIALRQCRRFPRKKHPWVSALNSGRKTGAHAVFAPLLQAARRAGVLTPKLSVISKVLKRLERTK